MSKFTEEGQEYIANYFLQLLAGMGMDKPHNFDEIVDYIVNDMEETTEPNDWNTDDIIIGFRRWIESQSKNQP